MFEDLLGNVQGQQAEIKQKLKELVLEESAEKGLLVITMNGAKEILNISIKPELMMQLGMEGLEDLLIVTINKLQERASAEEAKMMEESVKNMLPGLGGLKDLFS